MSKKLIFMPTQEEKKIVEDCAHEVIDIILKHCNTNLGMKAFVMISLIESFNDVYNIDLKNDCALHSKKEND